MVTEKEIMSIKSNLYNNNTAVQNLRSQLTELQKTTRILTNFIYKLDSEIDVIEERLEEITG